MLRQKPPLLPFTLITLAGLALILYLRLIPFDLVWGGHIPWERITLAPLNLRDAPLNVLLFVPFGFGLAGLLAGRFVVRRFSAVPESAAGEDRAEASNYQPRPAVGGQVLLISLLLSAVLEAIQLFMPSRAPSLADVAANGLGALLGYWLFRAWEMGFGHALRRTVTWRNLLLGLGLYVLSAALLTGYLWRSVRLDNWDTSFPLVVGNEAVGRRQWSGNVGYLTFTAYDDSGPLFSAAYAFGGVAPFEDATGSGAPSLDWVEGSTTALPVDAVTLGPGEWLATSDPLSGFSEAASATNAFSIETTVSSADPAQRGPARIVSISANAERRNVTIGQERDALIIRLRTPAGGENGQKPELLVPGVFADRQRRHTIVSYDAPMMRVLVDNEDYTLSLAPGAAFFAGFVRENRWPIVMTGDAHRYDWAYGVIVIGLAVLLFGGLAVARWIACRVDDARVSIN
jgi:glycopeptide antibiotics resistance protein